MIAAWNHYGLPGAFYISGKGDSMAFNCWKFLHHRKTKPDLTIDDFLGGASGKEVDEFRALLTEVLEKLDETS